MSRLRVGTSALAALVCLCTLALSAAHPLTRFAASARRHGGTPQKRAGRIPEQLILTGTWASLEELPGPIGRNVHKTLSLNPELHIRWLSDTACKDYLVQYLDHELV